MKLQEESLKKIASISPRKLEILKNCNLHKDYKNRLKFRRKRTRTIRPKAPHNTTTFLIEEHYSYEKDEKYIRGLKEDKEDYSREFCIDDFIITGGSMIGIFLNK